MINPTSQQYVNDLLKSNAQDFARIHSIEERIKKYRSKRYELEPHGMAGTFKEVANLTGKILLCYDEIKHLRGVINARLEEIKHVREGNKHGA